MRVRDKNSAKNRCSHFSTVLNSNAIPMLNKSSKQSAANIEYLSTKSIVLINVVTFKTNFQPNAILGFVTLLISIRKMYEENQLL